MTAPNAKTTGARRCQDAFQQIARGCLRAVRQHRAPACRGDPDAIHQIRIALTRLRAARKFFAAMTRDAVWPKLKVELRWLNAALGAARDTDVTAAYAGTAKARSPAGKHSKQLARATARTHRQLSTTLRSARCDRLLAGLHRWIDKGPWLTTTAAIAIRRRAQRLADYAPERLQRWQRRLSRRAADGLGHGRRRHRLRIAAKRYRYMREALTALGLPEDHAERRSREAAHSAQHALGELRDLARLRKWQPASRAARNYTRQKKRLLRKATMAFDRLG
jgi:CHAD domain-containing protein